MRPLFFNGAALLGALVLSACPGPEQEPEAEPEDLATSLVAPGAYNVGYRESEFSYTDPFGQPRTLPYGVWYPTTATDGDDVRYWDIFAAEGVLGGILPLPEGRFPVVVYSHGHSSYAQASGRVLAHLASHGFVGVAPDHVGNLFTDGDRVTQIYQQRPADLTALLDHVLSADLIADNLDSESIIAMGHSFGGYTVFASAGATYDLDVVDACPDGTEFCSTMDAEQRDNFQAGFRDTRIDALIAMAPGDWRLFKGGLATIDIPILHMTGEIDPSGGDNEDYWAEFTGSDDRRVDILQGGHLTFTDLSGGPLDPTGVIAAELGDPIVLGYSLAFVRRWTGDTSVQPVLDGEVELSEHAVLMRP